MNGMDKKEKEFSSGIWMDDWWTSRKDIGHKLDSVSTTVANDKDNS